MKEVLKQHRLESLYGILLKEAITVDELFDLTVENLHEMGITKMGHINRFLKAKARAGKNLGIW